jgi:CubicO group peptidase (beta-lactamase class C family)
MRGVALAFLALSACATTPRGGDIPISRVGVAFNREDEVGSFADGLADPAARRAVSPDDPVRIASVSKLVLGIGVMKLVERDRLDLDSDVSRWLGWSLRNPAFPERPITLRQLLSHTSSVRDHDDQYAIALGNTVQNVMAAPTSWDPKHGPGDYYFKYSNLNFPIVASIIERVTGDRFDRWMRREVIEPMKLDACYNWPTCSDSKVERAVVLFQHGKPVKDDLGGKQPDCPVLVEDGPCDLGRTRLGENGALFAPQGGLRISMRDLARVGRMLLNGGTLDAARIISPQSVDLMLTPVWRFNGSNGDTDHGFYCSYGIATQQLVSSRPGCMDDPAGDGVLRAGHAGDAYGLRSGLWVDRVDGTGVAYFVSGLSDDPPRGRSAYRAAEEAALRRSLELLGQDAPCSMRRNRMKDASKVRCKYAGISCGDGPPGGLPASTASRGGRPTVRTRHCVP